MSSSTSDEKGSPLTDLLKKDAFNWSELAENAFIVLKEAMTSAPVLHLPDFGLTFVVETDACDSGVGAVLLQSNHPITFFSKKLGPRRRIASVYHKELYAIVEAVQKWRQYLLWREFIICSDQKSLKELLFQVIQTPDQQFYIRKLMGFKFWIEYKQGAQNKVADALSRRDCDDEPAKLFAIFAQPLPAIISKIKRENETMVDLLELHKLAAEGKLNQPFHVADGVLYYNHRLCLSKSSTLKTNILHEFHSSLSAGHPGIERTFRRVAAAFYWPGMRNDVVAFVCSCHTCQVTKYSTQRPEGLLQPLAIPRQV